MLIDEFTSLIERLVGREWALANIVSASGDDIYLMDDTIIFTIRGIYPLLCNADEMTYIEFRTTLYQGNLNQQLGKLGYEVVISDSTGNIDTSWYQLRPLEVV